MFQLHRVRKLVRIVRDETQRSTAPMDRHNGGPNLVWCLLKFQQLKRRYTESLARQTLTVATGKQRYLRIRNSDSGLATDQELVVTDAGLTLLTTTGYLNELCKSVSGILAAVAVVISLIALVVSILAFQHNLPIAK